MVLQTIQQIQSNQEGCYRIAKRCWTILVDIRDHMAGHCDSAPPSLLRAFSRFEETLESIHKFMKQEAERKWSSRLLRKNRIENAIEQYHVALDDAARTFQITMLINLNAHLTVGDASRRHDDGPATYAVRLAQCVSSSTESTSSESVSTQDDESIYSSETDDDDDDDDCQIIEHHGFTQYHQSQIRLTAKSDIRLGWWRSGYEGEIDGRKVLALQYDADRRNAVTRWVKDVKTLQNIYHPNLPQMIGYSNDKTPIPFILLANVHTCRDPVTALFNAYKTWKTIRLKGHAAVKNAREKGVLDYLRSIEEAAKYLQRQAGLSATELRHCFKLSAFRVDSDQTIVMSIDPNPTDPADFKENIQIPRRVESVDRYAYSPIYRNPWAEENTLSSLMESLTFTWMLALQVYEAREPEPILEFHFMPGARPVCGPVHKELTLPDLPIEDRVKST
ncbi:hypothetical protein C2E23DRAFT_517278 [Lenzites betulinus]|nr:hypothetical protein C2E23DRAFT_517278 [Lenzites betulinus]